MKKMIIVFAIAGVAIVNVQAQTDTKKEVKTEKAAIKKRQEKEKRDKLAEDRANIRYEKQREKQDILEKNSGMKEVHKETLHEEKKKMKDDKKSKEVNPQ